MCIYEIRVFEPRIETNFSCTKLLASIKYYWERPEKSIVLTGSKTKA